jgi:hypothetical protein
VRSKEREGMGDDGWGVLLTGISESPTAFLQKSGSLMSTSSAWSADTKDALEKPPAEGEEEGGEERKRGE